MPHARASSRPPCGLRGEFAHARAFCGSVNGSVNGIGNPQLQEPFCLGKLFFVSEVK